jgi:hypothetical protein
MSTRGNGSAIARDPATGSREMKTPDGKPRPERQGPQTVIVAPEARLDMRPGPDDRRPR